jgi:hypothetical protein
MRALTAAVLVTLVTGCAAEEAPATYGEGLGTPENPIPEDELTYAVASRMDFTVNGAVPTQVTDATAALRTFAQNPARTLLTMADPTAVQQLKSAIGTTLSGNLETWINTEIDKVRVATKTMRQFATDVVSITETSLTKFYLTSALSMTPEKTTHSLTGLNFRPLSVDIFVPIGGLAADSLTQHPTLTVAPAGAITLGDQKFGLAFGKHAWSGINLSSTTIYGGAVQTTLSSGINCSVLAKTIAAKCVSTSCVGHESQLRAICDGATAAVISQLQQHVLALELDLFRFVAGTARLVDENNDGLADRIIEGTWDGELNLGTGVRKAAATFTATK